MTVEAQCTAAPALKLAWSAAANAQTYVIERDYVELATLTEASATEYIDDTVAAGNTYTYRLHARNGHGVTSSLPVSAAVPFDACRTVTTVATAFRDTTLVITESGTVWAFGRNDYAQHGSGDYNDHLEPVEVVGLRNVIAAALGSYHALALDSDGQVWVWGENYRGQTGLGRSSHGSALPVRLSMVSEITAVAAGENFSLAVADDGTVWAWGDNSNGQLGLGESVGIAFEPVQISGLEDVVAVFTGSTSAFALHSDDTLSVWGSNDQGQLGLGDTVNRFIPEPHPIWTSVRAVAAGEEFTLVLQSDGTLRGAGSGVYLGGGLSGIQPIPVDIPGLFDVVNVAAGESHALAVLSDGSVFAWGDNSHNQVGESATARVDFAEVAPGLADVVFVAAGDHHSVAVLASGAVLTWGANDHSQLGSNLPRNFYSFVPIDLPADVVQVSSFGHTLALLSDGSVWAWGEGADGQIGHGSLQDVFAPVRLEFPAGTVIEKVAAGHSFSLALDDTGMIWSWGNGGVGVLGHGDMASQLQPVKVTTVPALFTDISAGRRHALALDHLGDVWAWGANNLGQLGLGSTVDVNVPTRITAIANAVAIAAGGTHSAVVLSNGELWSFGSRLYGTLGDGGAVTGLATTPVMSMVSDVASVTASLNMTMVIKNDGTLSSWGSNSFGRLGLGHEMQEHLPVDIPGLADIVQISIRESTSLAVDSIGNVYGWGRAEAGQLGFAYLERTPTPKMLTLPAEGSASVAAGTSFSLLHIDGNVYGAGWDQEGQLGQERTGQRGTPEQVEGLPPAAVPE